MGSGAFFLEGVDQDGLHDEAACLCPLLLLRYLLRDTSDRTGGHAHALQRSRPGALHRGLDYSRALLLPWPPSIPLFLSVICSFGRSIRKNKNPVWSVRLALGTHGVAPWVRRLWHPHVTQEVFPSVQWKLTEAMPWTTANQVTVLHPHPTPIILCAL